MPSRYGNPWVAHVRKYAHTHECSYGTAMRLSAPSYRAASRSSTEHKSHGEATWVGLNGGEQVKLTFTPGPKKNPFITIQGGIQKRGKFIFAGFKRLSAFEPRLGWLASTGMVGLFERVVIQFFNYGSHQGGPSIRFKDRVVLFIKDKKSADKLEKMLRDMSS